MRPASILTGLLLVVAAPAAPATPAVGDLPSGAVELRGEIECFDETREPLLFPDGCDDPEARFGLRTPGGELFFFIASDPHAEMFIDPAVRSRELVIRGWHRPQGELEILAVYSLKDGQLHDLHYRCDVCNITAKAPGPCWCCREPFELREVPLDETGATAPPGNRAPTPEG